MKKIALISICKNPTQEELKQVHRLLSAQTAHVEETPSVGEIFVPVTACGTSQAFQCLRVDEKTIPTCNSIAEHDAIVYAEFSHHVAPTA